MKLIKVVKDPLKIIFYLVRKTNKFFVPEEIFIKLQYKSRMGIKLNLDKPKTMNEKLQWLKLYDRNPLYQCLVDKYDVRSYIKENIGEQYLIPLIGVWDRFEDIDLSKLPNQFVLKTTHDSGGVVICTDKSDFNFEAAKKKLNKSLKNNYYYHGCEWPYKNIKPKIICEKYISDEVGSSMVTDYKFYCFDGNVDSVMLCIDREKGDPKFYFFNKEWVLKRYNNRGKNAPQDFTIPKPNRIDEMFALAEKLSKDIPFVRIDMYCSDGKIYFGEFTFYPSSGYEKNILEEHQIKLGGLINLDLAHSFNKGEVLK
jgi:hypothetical protein